MVDGTSGEIYQQTSGCLQSQGYWIRAFNLLDVTASETYNPLTACKSAQDLAELAQLLVQSSLGNQGSSDPFWNQAAEKIIRIMAQCLLNQSDPQFQNLANLRHLIIGFDAHHASQGKQPLMSADQIIRMKANEALLLYESQ